MNKSKLLYLILLFLQSVQGVLAHGDNAPPNDQLDPVYKFSVLLPPIIVFGIMGIYIKKYVLTAIEENKTEK